MEERKDIGFVAGSFGFGIHPGYAKMFKLLDDSCMSPVVLLQGDPTIERPEKAKPIFTVEERMELIKPFFPYGIVMFLHYNTEEELYALIKSLKPDVRVLGDDYIAKDYTGKDLDIPVIWADRSHGWSTTKFRELIGKSL